MNFKLISLGLLLFFCYPTTYAQVSVANALAKTTTEVATKNLEIVLSQRIQESYSRAIQATSTCPEIHNWGTPSKNFINNTWIDPGYSLSFIPVEKLYPHATFLTPQKVPDYFLAKNNLEIAKWAPILKRYSQTLISHADVLRKGTTPITHLPQEDISWLAKQVTDQTFYLFLGETKHEDSRSSQTVAQLIHELRVQQLPERQIFVFTEFLSENQQWGHIADPDDIMYEEYIPIWEKITQESVPIFGLEPQFVADHQPCLQSENLGAQCHTGNIIWTSVEGVRLRNKYWKRTLQQYRAQYPQALFIVYAGGGHLEYTAPYSLGRTFANENVLNVLIDPVTNNEITQVGLFASTVTKMFPDRVLQFKDKTLAHIAGFDIRLLLPEEPSSNSK